jgi:hypothetical protein
MRCGSPAYSAAVPATVSEEPKAENHWDFPGRRPRRRPASQETCRQEQFQQKCAAVCVRNCENSNSERCPLAEIFPDEISDRLAGVPGKERVFEGR